MSVELESLLRKHQAVLQSEGGFACWECGDVKDPGAHQAEVVEAAGYAKRRTVIEDLVAKFEGKLRSAKDSVRWDYVRHAVEMLRIELEEG